MSWFEATTGHMSDARVHAALALLMAALVLAGCAARPLYGDGALTHELSQIRLDPIRVVGPARAGTLVARAIGARIAAPRVTSGAGGLNEGQDGAERYRLKIILDGSSREIGIEQRADIPAAQRIHLNATYTLSRLSDARTVLTGRSVASASYDFFRQRFANIRAERDAVERAAILIADDIVMRIAGHFSAAAD